MNGTRFYVLEHHPKPAFARDRTDFLSADTAEREDAPTCRECGKATGMLTLAPPYPVEIEIVGARPGDLAFKGSAQELLVSERLKLLYEQEGLIGLDIREPAEVVRLTGRKRSMESIPTYYYTRLEPTTTRVDHKASGSIFPNPEDYCPVCNTTGMHDAIARVVIEEGSWDGHDIFEPLGLADFVVSQRFRDFAEANEITNCLLIRAEEYSFDFYPERRASS